MFLLSKGFWLFAQPGTLIFIALIIGTLLLFTRFRRAGRMIVAATTTLLLLIATLSLGRPMVEVLENRFPANPAIPADVTGIISLGGALKTRVTKNRGLPTFHSPGRLTEFMYLANKYPDARLVFSGGSGNVFNQTLKEANLVSQFFERMDFTVTDDRLSYEFNSRNTYENAAFTHDLVKPDSEETWVLITSARHMPRAIGVFQKLGWEVIPYPVDFYTSGRSSFQLGFDVLRGLNGLSTGLREWLGLVGYYTLGRTDSLFPGPYPRTD